LDFENFSKKELINFVETLLLRVDVLEKQFESLNLKVAELQEENQILKVKKNSSNSSIAPSSDISKPNQRLRQKSNRKKGGQLGHKGHTLELSLTPDEIICHRPSFCKNCGKNLKDIPERLLERRQVLDIPPIVPIFTEHQSFAKTCDCGCLCKGDFPLNVNAPIQYGNNVESLIAYFYTIQYMPYKRMSECFSDIFDLKIAQGSIVNAITRFAKKAEPIYQKIKDQVQQAQVKGSDETGAVVNGKKGWFWAWQTTLFTFISFHKSRGFEAIKSVFSENFIHKAIVSDCWAAQLKAKIHQICTAHLGRELNYFIESIKSKWAFDFKDLISDALTLKKEIENFEIPNKKRQFLQIRLNKLLDIEKHSKNDKLKAFQKRLQKHKEKIFPFLYSKNIPPDNNASERAIRNIKVKQKILGQFTSEQKAQDFAVIRSIIDTAIKNKVNVFDSLKLIAQFEAE
jgi:transposase